MITRTSEIRAGLTLLEVIVGMAIFLVAMVAILQLVVSGGERAQDVRLQTRTSIRCQAKLAEVMVDPTLLNAGSGGYTPFVEDYDKDLQWKIEATRAEATGLWMVKVSVKAEFVDSGKIVESTLSQMVLDPSIRGTTFDQPSPPAVPATNGGG
jgi:prepilin-type N-terminal cleavage/methylation domain-containing protein